MTRMTQMTCTQFLHFLPINVHINLIQFFSTLVKKKTAGMARPQRNMSPTRLKMLTVMSLLEYTSCRAVPSNLSSKIGIRLLDSVMSRLRAERDWLLLAAIFAYSFLAVRISDIHTGHWAVIWAVDHPEREAGCKDWHYYATHPNMQTDQVVKTDVMLQLCPPPDDLWIPNGFPIQYNRHE